ncbi:MAG TPA: hypothetical protein VKQ30_25415 [Ktedonobacterales bacterium]|nr:hypothetical protein [Ktedonobacterales bacterium]
MTKETSEHRAQRRANALKNETPEHRAHRLAQDHAAHVRYRGTPKDKARKQRSNAAAVASGYNAAALKRRRARKRAAEREREQVAKLAARRGIVKPPRRKPYRGVPGQTLNRVEGERVQPFHWPEPADIAQRHFAEWWTDMHEGMSLKEIMWGRKQIAAEERYVRDMMKVRLAVRMHNRPLRHDKRPDKMRIVKPRRRRTT